MASIYVLGDSHTQVLGPRLKSRFPQHNVRVEAFAGHSTKRAHAKASIPSGQDVVVLNLGGNDWGNQAGARQALVSAVRLRNPRARIVWFGPFTARRTDVDARHAEQTYAQRVQLPPLGVNFVDTRPFSRTGHRSDGVHFTASGYSRIADSMKSAVASAVATASQAVRPVATGTGGGIALTLAVAGVALWFILRGS